MFSIAISVRPWERTINCFSARQHNFCHRKRRFYPHFPSTNQKTRAITVYNASFIINGMIAAAQEACSRSILSLHASFTATGSSTFDAFVWLRAVGFWVTINLAKYALYYVVLDSRCFNSDFNVLNKFYFINLFVTRLGFEVYEKRWQWILACSMPDVY